MVNDRIFTPNEKKSFLLPVCLIIIAYALSIPLLFLPDILKLEEPFIGQSFYFATILLMLVGLIYLAVIHAFKIHQYNMMQLQWDMERWRAEMENERYREQMNYTRELRDKDWAQQRFENYLRLVEMSKEKEKTIEKKTTEKTEPNKTSTTTEKISERESVSPDRLKALLKNQPLK